LPHRITKIPIAAHQLVGNETIFFSISKILQIPYHLALEFSNPFSAHDTILIKKLGEILHYKKMHHERSF
jgi:hypothetical protein